MKIDNLVTMSNQIGEFFESMPDRKQAVLDIALHLTRFWAPTMRHQLLDGLDQGQATDLRDIVRDALVTHAQMLR
ncbi:MAG: hypothetical protein NVSMB6_14230 [Burkholderiaceae bacterium]